MNKALKGKNIIDQRDRVVIEFLQYVGSLKPAYRDALIKEMESKGVKFVYNKNKDVLTIKNFNEAKDIIYNVAVATKNKGIEL